MFVAWHVYCNKVYMQKKLALLILFFPFFAYAQEDKMNTDIPDQSEATYVIKPHQLQVEEKLWFNYFEKNQNAFISSTLIRFGVVKRLEARIMIEEGKARDVFTEETTQSCSPLALSAKYSLINTHTLFPNITLVGYLQLPFTTQSSERELLWSPTFIVAAEKKIKKWNFSLNGGIKQNNFDPHTAWIAVSSVRYQVAKRAQVFVEYFAQYAATAQPSHNADAGVQYDIKSRLQLFMTAGTNIDAEEWNPFIATGCAFKLF